jgi:tetratricopeptide (TPR) repeat protein
MRGLSAPALLFSVLALIGLTGCLASPVHLDPGSVDGRDGGGPTPSYPMLMRIGAAAQSGGDLPNAVGVYRRAAEMAPQDPAPLIAAGDVLLKMGAANEAIVSYNQALVRPGDTQGAQIGLAKAFLKTGKPELALAPLSKALEASPDDPKLILLLGVTRDMAGQHWEAQSYYRNGLSRAPGDPALTLDLALSLALSAPGTPNPGIDLRFARKRRRGGSAGPHRSRRCRGRAQSGLLPVAPRAFSRSQKPGDMVQRAVTQN